MILSMGGIQTSLPQIEKDQSKFHAIHHSNSEAAPRQYLSCLEVYQNVLDNKKRGRIWSLSLNKNQKLCFPQVARFLTSQWPVLNALGPYSL